MNSDRGHSVEVCFSPALYKFKLTKEGFITVIVDILRASTSICSALDHGVKSIIPVNGIEEAKEYKKNGYTVACERDGNVLDFADIGNSPSDFIREDLKDVTIAFSTTNGTQAVNLASDADEVVIGSFINLSALAQWLTRQNKNVVILCAAWKNLFNLEDATFAGALSTLLVKTGSYDTECDSAKASMDLWKLASNNPGTYLSKSSHRNRLKHLVSDQDYMYTVTPDISTTIPVFCGDKLVSDNRPITSCTFYWHRCSPFLY